MTNKIQNVIRWGILGCGHIAEKFAADINISEGNCVQATASRDLTKSKAFATKFKAKTAYGSYEEMVKDPEVDIVYVATPHMRHYEDSVLCLESGKAVLCEKPVTVKYEDALKLYALAQKKGLFFMEALWTRFHPAFQKALEWAQEGRLGKVHQINADFGFQAPVDYSKRIYNPELAGGSLLDVGLYPAFLAMQFMEDAQCKNAQAIMTQSGVDGDCAFILKSSSGQLANLSCSITVSTPVLASITGDRGRIVFDRMFFMDIGATLETPTGSERIEGSGKGYGYQHEIAHCAECLEKGLNASFLWTPENSLSLHRVLTQIRTLIGLKYPFE